MSRRAQRWPTIFDGHREHLMRLSYTLWKECVPPMVSLRPEGSDYAAVAKLQAATITFSQTITGGVSWVPAGSTTPAAYSPSAEVDRRSEVEAFVAECGGDPTVAVRALMDTVAQLELDHERLLAQM